MTSARQLDPRPGLRTPDQVMNLARMGASHPTRLSFMRQLVRKLHSSRVRVNKLHWQLDGEGYGEAVYGLELDGFHYSLFAFTAPLDAGARTDRVIAEAWDATFALHDGPFRPEALERLRQQVPRQEAGRFLPSELVISRANKSLRMFEHVTGRISQGRQPDIRMIRQVGYLMRTTAVYGNGKFGLADRCRIADRSAFSGPFQAELLTVWLIREFSLDLVEHIARSRNPDTAGRLSANCRRSLGIGNATGLGMAPFLVGHPALFNNWMMAKETALARVRELNQAEPEAADRFVEVLHRARTHVSELEVDDTSQSERNAVLADEIAKLISELEGTGLLDDKRPWEQLYRRSLSFSFEAQELLVSVLMEPHGDLVDDLGAAMSCDREFEFDPSMTVAEILLRHERYYSWTRSLDFSNPDSDRKFWYVSEDKLEPRIGDRYREPGAEKELPLDVARQFKMLGPELRRSNGKAKAAEFLLSRPELRMAVRRVQNAPDHPYAEIRDNLVSASTRPIDLLRCKLAFFGATKFDPKSDLWTRITLFQGAPSPVEINSRDADDWSFPVLCSP